VDALPFFAFVKLQKNAALVLSDSVTVQEGCAIFGVPVITIRDTTERPETMECGSNLASSTHPETIVRATSFLHAGGTRGSWDTPAEYLAHNVADRVLRILFSNPVWASGMKPAV
jgi:UDP-N-acetylglucosamine 2-epimerase (non-hydrolysing)